MNERNIHDDTYEYDNSLLDCSFWKGILQGKDSYPKEKDGNYFISGGTNRFFKAASIEFFGLKIPKMNKKSVIKKLNERNKRLEER